MVLFFFSILRILCISTSRLVLIRFYFIRFCRRNTAVSLELHERFSGSALSLSSAIQPVVVQPGTAGGGVNEQERIIEVKKKIVIDRVTFGGAMGQQVRPWHIRYTYAEHSR